MDGLSGCAGLQTLTLEGLKSLASMPDLSALVSLKVKGLPSHLQAWENSGRKRFFRAA